MIDGLSMGTDQVEGSGSAPDITAKPDDRITEEMPQGGMRLGRNPEVSAVSPRYNVHGTTNLMVADASLFPSTIVVNPQWTVMALALAASEQIEQRIHGTQPRSSHELTNSDSFAAQ